MVCLLSTAVCECLVCLNHPDNKTGLHVIWTSTVELSSSHNQSHATTGEMAKTHTQTSVVWRCAYIDGHKDNDSATSKLISLNT